MTDNVIGRKIRMALEWRDMTFGVLSEKVGIEYYDVWKYINGNDTPDSTTLIAIAKALGVSIDWLMTDLETTDILMREGLEWRRRNFDRDDNA